ncbi:hypothetical protein SAMN02745163_03737 [Clostridium cavendishii DSM 21758]|uniref:Uncharacterized protein n=1 Tax=Clostridium cavendishii DSM 21758 TaxID=1121302 RepID=A0A1M6S2W7_9CLOT|nr:hypothetical protein [Clostridium cavendishii]SHK39020.1 hypothetical protein SAMN02745163_03737 [Clostridium cavendishii DSM 21758]
MNKIKRFYNHNKVLSSLAILTFINCIVFIITNSWPEIYPGLGELYKFSYDLSLAYLGSLIFYIVQVYIVNEKKKESLRKQIFSYLFSIHAELYTAKYSLKTLNISLEKDYEAFKKASNKVVLEFEPRNDEELNNLFNQNIVHSLTGLDKYLNTIEEYMKTIYSINISSLGSNMEFLDEKIQRWIEQYRTMKAYRIEYHNRMPQSEALYYKCMLSTIEEMYKIYDENYIKKELNINN